MAKVYVFPTKPQLSEEVDDCLYEIAKAYVKTLKYALDSFCDENATEAEMEEVRDLVVQSYAKGLYRAIDELEL